MAADGSVVIEILGDAKDITAKLKGIAGGAVKMLTTAITAAGTALAGVSAAAIKVGSGFEESMSQVAATMGLSVEEIQNGSEAFTTLQNAAKEAGATTAFSASEAASALNYLALAGYDAATSAEVLPSVLNLAAAGGMDLAYASDLATDAMAALGIEASSANLEQFGDQLAAAASNANASVSQLGEAILVVGGTAKSLAGGTTELNAALGVLANRGIKGAEGGTALRNIILSLSAPTDKAASALEDLGVAVYDAEGNMRPLNDVFQDLSASMEGMTEGDKTNVLSDIFNKVDLKSAQALLAGTGEEFDALAEAVENSQGAMEDMAAVQLDNLNGDITILKSGLEGLGIALYETMQVNARDAVQSITGAVGAISEALTTGGIPAAIEVAGQQIAGFATAIAGQAPKIISAGTSLIQSLLKGIRDNLPALVSAAVDIVGSLSSGILELVPDLATTGVQILIALADGIIQAVPQIGEQLPQIITGIAEFITTNLPIFVDKGIELLNALAEGMLSDIPGLISTVLDALTAISETVLENAGKLVNAGIVIIKNIASGIIESIPTLIEKVPTIVSNIANIINENAPKLLSAGVEIISQLILGLVEAIPTLIANIPQIITAIVDVWQAFNWLNLGKTIITGIKNGITSMISTLKTASQNIVNTITDALKNLPQTLLEIGQKGVQGVINGIQNLIPSLGTAAQKIISAIIDVLAELPGKALEIGKNLIEGLWNGISDMAGWIASKIQGFGEGVLGSLKSFFGIQSPSRVMRDEVGKMLGLGIALGIEESTKTAVDSAKEMASSISNEISQIADDYSKKINEIASAQDSLFGKLSDTGKLFERTDTGIEFSDLQADIDAINEYRDAITELQDRMVDETLLSEIMSMNQEDATAFSKALLAMSDDEYTAYMDLWQQKQQAAKDAATAIYSDQFSELKQQFDREIPGAIKGFVGEMRPIGEEAMQELTQSLEENGAKAKQVAEDIADDIAEQLSRITDLSSQLKSAVAAESARLSAQLTVNSNAPAEAAAARARSNAAQNAAANAAMGSAYPVVDVTLTMDGDVLARKQVDPMRKAFAEKPEVLDDT